MFRKSHLLLYLIAFFLPWQVGFYADSLLGITFTPMLVLGLLLFLLLTLKVLLSLRIPRFPFLAWWLAFVGFSIIAYIQSPLITSSVQGIWLIFRMSVLTALLYIGFWCFMRSPEQVKTLLFILAISAGIAGVAGIIQTLSGGQLLSGMLTNGRFLGFLFPFPPEVLQENSDVLRAHFFGSGLFRAHGFFYRANGFGAFMSITSILTWGLWRSTNKGIQRNLLLGACLAQMAGVLVSFSRSAWLALILGMIIVIGLEMRLINRRLSSRNILLIITVLFIAGIGIIALLASPEIAARLETLKNPLEVVDFTWRINIWEKATQAIAKHPLGVGHSTVVVQTSAQSIISYGEQTSGQIVAGYGAHNFLLGLAYERGIPALITIVFFLGMTMFSLYRWLRTKQPYAEKMIAAGIFAPLITLLTNGVGGALVDIENNAVLMWLLICVGILWSRKKAETATLAAQEASDRPIEIQAN